MVLSSCKTVTCFPDDFLHLFDDLPERVSRKIEYDQLVFEAKLKKKFEEGSKEGGVDTG